MSILEKMQRRDLSSKISGELLKTDNGGEYPPAATCPACNCPGIWLDPFGRWHCPDCEPWPSRSMVCGKLMLVVRDPAGAAGSLEWKTSDPSATPIGGGPGIGGRGLTTGDHGDSGDSDSQADNCGGFPDPDNLDERRWRVWTYATRGGQQRRVIERRDFRWVPKIHE